jgi:hypothetical protein
MSAEFDPDAERAAYRRFVRTHHPDVGGDPEVFMAGLARFRAGTPAAKAIGEAPDDRYAAPVVFVTRPRGLRRLLAPLRRKRRRPSRVR